MGLEYMQIAELVKDVRKNNGSTQQAIRAVLRRLNANGFDSDQNWLHANCFSSDELALERFVDCLDDNIGCGLSAGLARRLTRRFKGLSKKCDPAGQLESLLAAIKEYGKINIRSFDKQEEFVQAVSVLGKILTEGRGSEGSRVEKDVITGLVVVSAALLAMALGMFLSRRSSSDFGSGDNLIDRGESRGPQQVRRHPRALKPTAIEPKPRPEAAHVVCLIVPANWSASFHDILTANDAQELRKHYTWIWYGSKYDFQILGMEDLLKERRDGPTEDVFNVRCVVITLSGPDQRFAADASPLDRHEAFASLSDREVQVSTPLPIERIKGLPFRRN